MSRRKRKRRAAEQLLQSLKGKTILVSQEQDRIVGMKQSLPERAKPARRDETCQKSPERAEKTPKTKAALALERIGLEFVLQSLENQRSREVQRMMEQ